MFTYSENQRAGLWESLKIVGVQIILSKALQFQKVNCLSTYDNLKKIDMYKERLLNSPRMKVSLKEGLSSIYLYNF